METDYKFRHTLHDRDLARRLNYGQQSFVSQILQGINQPTRIEIDCIAFRSGVMAFAQAIAPPIGFEDIYEIPINENAQETTENDTKKKKGPQLSRKQQKQLTKAQREEDNYEPPKITGKEASFLMLPVCC